MELVVFRAGQEVPDWDGKCGNLTRPGKQNQYTGIAAWRVHGGCRGVEAECFKLSRGAKYGVCRKGILQ